MNFFRVPSLQERASIEVALNLCQDDDFKEVALRLEKPTYGSEQYTDIDDYQNEKWEEKVTKQCHKLMGKIPYLLKIDVHTWIPQIALEYFSYCQRLEVLFGVSRYFLMNFLTRSDWTEDCRLDELELAKRLVKDKQLTVLQQYRIACANCLIECILILWNLLTVIEKETILKNVHKPACYGGYDLVHTWSRKCEMGRYLEIMLKEWDLQFVVEQLVLYGNQSVLIQLWRKLNKHFRQNNVVKLAISALQNWQNLQCQSKLLQEFQTIMKRKIRSKVFHSMKLHTIRMFNLPSYYTKLVLFFLSKMHEKQQRRFFTEAFNSNLHILNCFLDWPLQKYFFQTINSLWEIIPIEEYKKCFLFLLSKYCGSYYNDYNNLEETVKKLCSRNFTHLSLLPYANGNRYYDCRNLIWKLWEKTPEEYKQYVLCTNKFFINSAVEILYPLLLEKSPFEEKDEALFKGIFCDLPDEKRLPMINSKTGTSICLLLIAKEKWNLLDWLLQQCLPKEKIFFYKKQFIQSACSQKLSFLKLQQGNKKFFQNFIDWSFVSDTEKTQYKIELAEYTCDGQLLKCKWEELDKLLVGCFDKEEDIRDFKNNMFSHKGVDLHFQILFVHSLNDPLYHPCMILLIASRFYEWFSLSPEDIKQLKKETLNVPDIFLIIENCLNRDINDLSFEEPLRWCLTDEKLVIHFKKCVKVRYTELAINEKEAITKKHLNNFLKKLLLDFRKNAQDKIIFENSFVQVKGEKRLIVDESLPHKKHFK